MNRIVDSIRERLREELGKGGSDEDAERIVRHLGSLDFASLISLAAIGGTAARGEAEGRPLPAAGSGAGDLARVIATNAEVRARLAKVGASPEGIRPFLEAFFTPGSDDPENVIDDEKLRNAVLRALANHVVKSHGGISMEDARKAAALLEQGVLFEDLDGVTCATARVVEGLPRAVIELIRKPVTPALEIIAGVLRDLREAPPEAIDALRDLFGDIARGERPHLDASRAAVLDGTLSALLDQAPADLLRDWAVEVLEYESVKLAILIYARVHGVKLEERDLDAVADALHQNDLAPILAAAVERFGTRAGGIGEIRNFFPFL